MTFGGVQREVQRGKCREQRSSEREILRGGVQREEFREERESAERGVERGRVERGECRENNLNRLTRLGRLRARSGYI